MALCFSPNWTPKTKHFTNIATDISNSDTHYVLEGKLSFISLYLQVKQSPHSQQPHVRLHLVTYMSSQNTEGKNITSDTNSLIFIVVTTSRCIVLTIRNESKTSYPMNQTGLRTRVYRNDAHETRSPGSRQKSSRYQSAVTQPVKIGLEQLRGMKPKPNLVK